LPRRFVHVRFGHADGLRWWLGRARRVSSGKRCTSGRFCIRDLLLKVAEDREFVVNPALTPKFFLRLFDLVQVHLPRWSILLSLADMPVVVI